MTGVLRLVVWTKLVTEMPLRRPELVTRSVVKAVVLWILMIIVFPLCNVRVLRGGTCPNLSTGGSSRSGRMCSPVSGVGVGPPGNKRCDRWSGAVVPAVPVIDVS